MTQILLPPNTADLMQALDKVKCTTTMAQDAADREICRAPAAEASRAEFLAHVTNMKNLLEACRRAVEDTDEALKAAAEHGSDNLKVAEQLADKLAAHFTFTCASHLCRYGPVYT